MSLWFMVFITIVTGVINQLISWRPHIVGLCWTDCFGVPILKIQGSISQIEFASVQEVATVTWDFFAAWSVNVASQMTEHQGTGSSWSVKLHC